MVFQARVWPKSVWPKSAMTPADPLAPTPLRLITYAGPPKISLFFSSPTPIIGLFVSLWVSSR